MLDKQPLTPKQYLLFFLTLPIWIIEAAEEAYRQDLKKEKP